MMPAIYGNAYQIVQGPGWVGIRYEMIHEARIIPLDGRPHASGKIRTFMGDAHGHWEGDTLVVETTNFTAGCAIATRARTSSSSSASSPSARTRSSGRSPSTIRTTWTRPWTFAMNLSRRDASQQPFEYACHEGNYGMRNMLNAARKAEKAAK